MMRRRSRRRTSKAIDLFGEAGERLPLFDALPPRILERLVELGFGRGLLTASLRARLRKAGFVDLAHLALATPMALEEIRKIGPIRIEAIRLHILAEIGRIDPSAGSQHAPQVQTDERNARLSAIPADRLSPNRAELGQFIGAGATCADIAAFSRIDLRQRFGFDDDVIDRLVASLADRLSEGRPPQRPSPPPVETPDREAERLRTEQREARLARDREWDRADPRRLAEDG